MGALSILAPSAYADECSGIKLTPRILKLDGQEYIALPTAQAACLTKRAEQYNAQQEVMNSQERVIQLQERQIATASVALAATKDLTRIQEERANEFNALALKQAEQLDAWYRQPVFWLGVGVVGTTVLLALLRGAQTSNTISVVPAQ
jgi:hypothetical protein